jgi:hypothetical protein
MTRQVPRPLLLKMVTAESEYRRKLKARLAKYYGLFFLLGLIAGYSLAMTIVTGDIYWMPWKDYDITVKPPTK